MSEFQKGQIVSCNDCELLLCDIAKKLNHDHSSIDVFLRNKTGNYHQKGHGCKKKTLYLKIVSVAKWLHSPTL